MVGTHGRSFWILDDITPLRQLDAEVTAAPAHLFQPQVAYRVRWNTEHRHAAAAGRAGRQEPARRRDPRLLPEAKPAGPVTLEIFDDKDKLVRRYSSADRPRAGQRRAS